MRRDGHACVLCSSPASVVDHLVPGIEDDSNLRALCQPCSDAKTQAEAAAGAALARP
jgi:5-methylcytosine-specific restriction endonuclease McrA